MFVDNIDPCCTEEQRQALKMMENWKQSIELSLAEAGVPVEFSPEELFICERIKQMIEDFWYT